MLALRVQKRGATSNQNEPPGDPQQPAESHPELLAQGRIEKITPIIVEPASSDNALDDWGLVQEVEPVRLPKEDRVESQRAGPIFPRKYARAFDNLVSGDNVNRSARGGGTSTKADEFGTDNANGASGQVVLSLAEEKARLENELSALREKVILQQSHSNQRETGLSKENTRLQERCRVLSDALWQATEQGRVWSQAGRRWAAGLRRCDDRVRGLVTAAPVVAEPVSPQGMPTNHTALPADGAERSLSSRGGGGNSVEQILLLAGGPSSSPPQTFVDLPDVEIISLSPRMALDFSDAESELDVAFGKLSLACDGLDEFIRLIFILD